MSSNAWFGYMGNVGLYGMNSIGTIGVIFALLIILVMIALKGYALWYAAKGDQKWWFIILLVLNTLGILELIYLVFVAKRFRKPNAQVSDMNQSSNPPAATV